MEWTHVSAILQIAALVFTAGGMYYSVRNIEKRMINLEGEMKALVTVMVTQGRQEERMTAMDQRILAQGQRLDEFMKGQAQAQERMARMVEATISRVNLLADRGTGDGS